MEGTLINYQKDIIAVSKKLDAALTAYEKDAQMQPHIQEIRTIYQHKIKDIKPKLMVYGIYNAGKSSILNELLGEDRAKTADIPQTDKVDAYPWNGYELFDTPGVGAPIKHENVTNTQLKEADIVMFVMSTTGSNEKAENYRRMKDIADAGKKIIIVLNDKNGDLGTNDQTIQHIKQQVAQHMQQVGIADVEKKYTIVTVNAKRARMGRIKQKPILWEKSNMDELRRVIMSELKHTDSLEVLRKFVFQLQSEVQAVIQIMEKKEAAGDLKNFDKLLQEIRNQKIALRKEMDAYIQLKAEAMGKQLPERIWQLRDDQAATQAVIDSEIKALSEKVQQQMNMKLRDMCEDLSDFIKTAKQYSGQRIQNLSVNSQGLVGQAGSVSPDGMDVSATVSEEGLTDKLLDVVGNTVLKEGASAIAEQIAKTTVGKYIATTALGKVAGSLIPIVGPVLTVVSVLSSLLGGNSAEDQRRIAMAKAETEARRQQAEAETQLRQELQQKCQYMADDLADQLIQAVHESLRIALADIEAPFKELAEQGKSNVYANANTLSQVRGIYDEYEAIRKAMGGVN